MPQKRNPISSEILLANERSRDAASLMLDAMVQDLSAPPAHGMPNGWRCRRCAC